MKQPKPTEQNTVTFWSIPEIFEKERKGLKPNTVRYFNNIEPKFTMLKERKAKFIQIECKGKFYKGFIRKIKDVTYWKKLVIISW